MQIHGLDLTPFVLGAPRVAPLPIPPGVGDVQVLDVLAGDTRVFGRLLNAANALAFQSLGMPLWVQLDCATVPSAFHGFAAPRAALPADVWSALVETHAQVVPDAEADRLADYAGLVPVSAFCALRTGDPNTISAISMFSILRGHALGRRAKALGLLGHAAARQVGVTQYPNAAVRVHTQFGALEILATRALGHTYASNSFVYALAVPAAERLQALLRDDPTPAQPPVDGRLVAIDEATGPALADRLAAGEPIRIVAPGQVASDDGLALVTA